MSGLIGHTMYGILAEKAMKSRGLPVVKIIAMHRASFLCGAYLGCDIQVMPEAVCVETGREVGFGTVPLEISPITGGALRPWVLVHQDSGFVRNKSMSCSAAARISSSDGRRRTCRCACPGIISRTTARSRSAMT